MARKISQNSRSARRTVRAVRSRARVRGTAARPRLSVFRSHRHLAVQLLDDNASRTLLGLTTVHLPKKGEAEKGLPAAASRQGGMQAGLTRGVARARALGKLLAERAGALGITAVVFDRRGYAYHGQVQALAEGARAGGLKF